LEVIAMVETKRGMIVFFSPKNKRAPFCIQFQTLGKNKNKGRQWIHCSFPKFISFWSAFYELDGDWRNAYHFGKHSRKSLLDKMDAWDEDKHQEIMDFWNKKESDPE
jgi:hypothetical protein